MKNVGNHNKKSSESGSRDTPGSDDAYSTLQKNYSELLREHSRALIAVDQLRVAKYLACPRVYQSKGVGTPIETQTDNPEIPADMEAAVTELEAQISECVPLFTGNSDPVGDLQVLLQGLQGELAECLRNSDEINCHLKERVAECEEKIRNMEGALSLKILDQNNSRGNSRASSRAANRHGTSLCHTSSLLSGADSSDNNFSAVNSFANLHSTSPHYNTSDFERDEEMCAGDSLSDIIDMHNELRAESEVVTDTDAPESVHSGQFIPRSSRRNDSYMRSCSDNDSENATKSGHKHTSDSALGSSVTVNRKSSSKGVQEKPRSSSRNGRGGLKVSNSDNSIASSNSKRMLYCTPIVGSQPPSRASTPAKGYDFNPGPGSYANSEYNCEVQDIMSGRSEARRNSEASPRQFENNSVSPRQFENNTSTRQYDGRKGSVDEEIAKRQPIRAKRSRVLRRDNKVVTAGYDSGYNEEGSRKSSPNRQVSLGSPKTSPRSAQEFRSEISMVRDDVQELADRLRNLRSSINSSRSSSPVLPPRNNNREAIRDRLRRLQCGSPADFDVRSGRGASPDHSGHDRYRSSSPQAQHRSSSPRGYNRSSSPAGHSHNRSSSPRAYNRSSSPGARHIAPRSPVLGYNRPSSRSHSPDVRNYRDSRHLFYDRPPEVGHNGYPPKPPIEVGVRIGGPSSAANFDVGPSHSPRAVYPIETFHDYRSTRRSNRYSLSYPSNRTGRGVKFSVTNVSPTSGLETHFHFNFHGNNGDYGLR